MFANIMVSPKIEQIGDHDPVYNFVSGNTFKLPVEGSNFTFQCFVVIGDFKDIKNEDSFHIDFALADNKSEVISNMTGRDFGDLYGKTDSITIVANFNNVSIPKYGKYVISFYVNDNLISEGYLSFVGDNDEHR